MSLAYSHYFGTDGIRGLVGVAPMTPEIALRVAYATACALKEHYPHLPRLRVVMGQDTRISGDMIRSAMEAGFTAGGIDIVHLGIVPTAAVAYFVRTLQAQTGVVISASHNPYDDNGIKFFSDQGVKLSDTQQNTIEKYLKQDIGCVPSRNLGRVSRVDNVVPSYIEFCKSTFPKDLSLKGYKIVVDCANGAAYQIAPLVFEELGAKVIPIYNQPDGCNINAECGATHITPLVNAVKQHQADLGIALDGDADRLIVCDKDGQIYDGDHLLYLIIAERRTRENIKGVVGTLMSNLALEQALGEWNIPFVRSPVGDRHVFDYLQGRGWLYGGENSGHLLCLDCHTTGDGIIAALQVFRGLIRLGISLSDLRDKIRLYPQIMGQVPLMGNAQTWQPSPILIEAKETAESVLAGRGRILIRPSGTEPILRIMLEGDEVDKLNTLMKQLLVVASSPDA